MLKRLLSAVVLLTLLVHLAGVYLFTIVRLGEIRMEQRYRLASLPEDQLEIIRIPVSQFRNSWMEEREIEWQGKMYDLARVVRKGSVITVYALHDEDEDNLMAFLSAVVNTAQQDTHPAPPSVVQFFNLEFITSSILIPLPAQSGCAEANPASYFAILCVVLDPAFPPPRV